jgi:uncharacterized coiled-coil protein SlyX
LPPIDVVSSQVPKVSTEPESSTEYTGRIADLEGRLKSLKQQTITATNQAKKSAALSQKVSSLEEQMSALMAKFVLLKECNLYMTEIVEAASEQL